MDTLDKLLPIILGLATVALAGYLLWRLWGERKGRPGLVLVVVLMWAGGGSLVWWGVATFLTKI